MESMWSACGMDGLQGPAIAAMAAGMGVAVLLWLVPLVLIVLGIVWLLRSLGSKPKPPGGDALAQAGS